MPAPETRVALANLDAIAAPRVLQVGLGPELAEALAARGAAVTVLQHDLLDFQACAHLPGARFGAWPPPDEPYPSVLLRAPISTERLRMDLAIAASAVASEGTVTLIGRNDLGIRSAGPHLASAVGPVETLDYRHHCRALQARAPAGPPRDASLADWRAEGRVEVRGERLRVVAYPGVFAFGRLDEGTRLLLETVAPPDRGPFLDACCGAGVVGAWLARARPGAEVDCTDTDAVAVRATEETLEANGARARVVATDVFPPEGGPYTLIASNPPFHRRARRSTETAERLIAGAPERLAPGGELWVVASRAVDHGGRLRAAFGSVEVAREDRRYRVWRATM